MNKIPELDLQQCLSISNLLGIIIEESYEQDQSTAFDCRENERFVVRKYNGEYKLFDNNAEAETYFILQINECYTKLLKLADEQGLLTKEASLALKPDNHIEWKYTYVSCDVEYITGTSKVMPDKELFISLDEAKQFCQDWVDNKLKEQNGN